MRLELHATQPLLFAVRLKLQRDKIPKEHFRYFLLDLCIAEEIEENSRMLKSVGFRASVCMVMRVEQCKRPDALR